MKYAFLLLLPICLLKAQDTAIKLLQSDDRKQHRKAAATIIRRHRNDIAKLVEIAKKHSENDPVSQVRMETVVHILAELRAAEAVPVLLKNIDYIEVMGTDLTRYKGRAAVQALVSIGMPSVKAILEPEQLAKVKEEHIPHQARVLQEVLGKKLAIAAVDASKQSKTDLAKTIKAYKEYLTGRKRYP